MKVIIAGSRDVNDYKLVELAIKRSGFKITEVVSGMADGVDKIGIEWAKNNNVKWKEFPADWKNLDAPGAIIRENSYGKYNVKAGFDRNEEMGAYAERAIIIIKDESKGSTHMKETMDMLGKKVHVEYV
jgi:hypothetical protein